MQIQQRIGLFLALVLTLPVAAHADSIGGVAGANFATFSTDNADTETGLMLGAFYEHQLMDEFYVEPQLRYVQRGGSFNDGNNQIGLEIDYIDLPIYAKYKFLPDSAFRPYVFGGPYLGFKVSDSGYTKNRLTGVTVTGIDVSGAKSFDFGLEGGVGGEFAFTDTMTGRLAAAYTLGLADVSDTGDDSKNRGFQIYAGLGFAY
jgi:hypothetical protein